MSLANKLPQESGADTARRGARNLQLMRDSARRAVHGPTVHAILYLLYRSCLLSEPLRTEGREGDVLFGHALQSAFE